MGSDNNSSQHLHTRTLTSHLGGSWIRDDLHEVNEEDHVLYCTVLYCTVLYCTVPAVLPAPDRQNTCPMFCFPPPSCHGPGFRSQTLQIDPTFTQGKVAFYSQKLMWNVTIDNIHVKVGSASLRARGRPCSWAAACWPRCCCCCTPRCRRAGSRAAASDGPGAGGCSGLNIVSKYLCSLELGNWLSHSQFTPSKTLIACKFYLVKMIPNPHIKVGEEVLISWPIWHRDKPSPRRSAALLTSGVIDDVSRGRRQLRHGHGHIGIYFSLEFLHFPAVLHCG